MHTTDAPLTHTANTEGGPCRLRTGFARRAVACVWAPVDRGISTPASTREEEVSRWPTSSAR